MSRECGCGSTTLLQTFPDDSNFRGNGQSSFGFMILLLFNILQFITISILVNIEITK